ncbi:hypothetical protein ZWY2020_038412 [Hordeum vulgare]|nr:hypothetical protein ZWY2020_038412 [Hordeum vulgare]
MAIAMEIVISAEDVAFEEDVLREPFKLSSWVRYLLARRAATPGKRAVIYERALRALPGSYKLWHAYLTELTDGAHALPVTDRAHANLNATFERALAAGMSRMPRVWHMYASSLLHQRELTNARRALNRALRSLPVTQHHHVWPLLLRLASLPGCPAPTTHRVLRRHLQFDPDQAEDFIAFLVSDGRWKDAAEHLVEVINDDGFVSAKGKSKRQLLLDLCGLLAQHPEEVAGLPLPVDSILVGSIHKFPDEAGVLWTSLASHYARMSMHDKARDVFEEGITTATTVKDFRMVFEACVHFEHALIAVQLDERVQEESPLDVVQDCWLVDRDNADMTMARLERLLERRPELLNSVLLRQNPHDVQAWHERAKIFDKDPARQAATYVQAVKTVDPTKATGKPHTLWLALAKMYANDGLVDSARLVFQRATRVNFKAVDHLATIYYEWAQMEVMQQQPERAIDLIRQATSQPSVDASSRAAAAVGNEPLQMKLHRSQKLWCMYLDLMKTHASFESICAVYDRMHDVGIITPLLVLNHASLLEEHKRFEDAFRVYERGVNSFKSPHSDAIWEAYLTKFVHRNGNSRPERVRDMFASALLQAPPKKKKALYLEYAKYEEVFGLVTRAMKIYEDAASAVPACDRLDVYEVYILRATQFCGLVKVRNIYSQAIHSDLLDKDARAMCIKFADLEIGLGEVARARALYAYVSSFTDPKAHPGFWKRWNDFEVSHGDETTFREMLRMKRTMTAAASAIEMDAIRAAPKRSVCPCARQQLDHEGIGEQRKRRCLA